MKVIPVILCGGLGERLWPVSREVQPKQFWALLSELTLLQETVAMVTEAGFEPPLIVCSEAHRFLVAEQLRAVNGDQARILLEPAVRDTAPAVAAAAELLAAETPDAVMWVMAADAGHWGAGSIREVLWTAMATAKAGKFVFFASQASGMFAASIATLREAFDRHAPEVLHRARNAIAAAQRNRDFWRLGDMEFGLAPTLSIEEAVLGKVVDPEVVEVPVAAETPSASSWDALWEASDKDVLGNAVSGMVELRDSAGCYVRSDGPLTAVVGMRDVVVVTTDDAVLVMPRSDAGAIKEMVEGMRGRGLRQVTEHRRMHRPWGHYEGISRGHRFQVKQIEIQPGAKLSLQRHFHRSEHWVVVRGMAIVQRDQESAMVQENESIYLPLGCVHRVENPGKIPLTLIEVQVGSYLGEDDIVRFEDNYGRASTQALQA